MDSKKLWSRLALLLIGLVVLSIWSGSAEAGSPIGNLFVVADLDVDAVNPSVAHNYIWDEYLVVWYNDRPGNDDIYGQLVSSDGTMSDPRRAITSGAGAERRYPDVAYSRNWNEYLVVWEHLDTATGAYSIRGQRVTEAGNPTGNEITISTAGPYSGWRPKVAHAFTAGVYLVVWENHTQGNVSNDIVAQRVSNDGSLIGTNFVVAQGTWQFSHSLPDLAYDRRRNEFLVAWQREDKNAGLNDIYAHIVRPDASMPPDDIEIARYTVDSTRPAVGAIPTVGSHGQYLVAWELQYAPNDKDIMARMVEGDGTVAPSDFYVISAPNDHIQPAVAGNEWSQTYLVTWTEDRSWSDIHAREVTYAGTMPQAKERLAGIYAEHSAVAAGQMGDFMTAFDDATFTGTDDMWGYLWGNRMYLPLVNRNH